MSKEACLTIPLHESDSAIWIAWHKSLKKCVGKKNANQLFLLNYDKEAPSSNIELREYMRSQGVDLDRDTLERLTDFGAGVYNWGSGVLNFANYTAMAVVLIIVGGAGLMIYNIVKTPEGSTRLAAGIATRGMSETAGAIGGGSPKQISG